MIQPLVLIPAAGFGVRAGEPPAKELLPLRENSENKILIEEPLRWCQQRNWPCLVIIRKNKTVLIDYLQNYHPKVQIQLIESSKDWQDTLLQSQNHWASHNLVLLPDVEFNPLTILDQMISEWSDQDVIAATHNVTDVNNWGFILKKSNEEFSVFEKPPALLKHPHAWGIFGFKKDIGQTLLEAQMKSHVTHQEIPLKGKISTFSLESFKDLTRSKKVFCDEL
jgi:UTP-glucose-1-phosphate uridylyltransferase